MSGRQSAMAAGTHARLRRARSADFEILAGWLDDAVQTLHWAGPKVRFPFDNCPLENQLLVRGGRSLVLETRAGLVAFGQFWPGDEGCVHFGRIIAAPLHRGQGWGRELCIRLMDAAASGMRPQRMSLKVYRSNTIAMALYRSLSFSIVDARSDADVAFMQREAPESGPRPSP